jgi:hypothetical protein
VRVNNHWELRWKRGERCALVNVRLHEKPVVEEETELL